MPRRLLALLFLALPLALHAQTVQHPFTFTHVPTAFPSVRSAIAAWADFDGDGDLDLFLSGNERLNDSGEYGLRAHLYRNDGVVSDPGVPGGERPLFTEQPGNLTPMAFGDAAWTDHDRDGDLDLLVIGSTTTAPRYTARTLLYRNDSGALTPVDAQLPDLHSGQVAWADHDGDGDLDLLLTGTASTHAPYVGETRLYLNQAGSLAEAPIALPGLVFGAIAWRDFTGDERPDVYLSGLTDQGLVTHRYEQRGRAYELIGQETGVLFGRAVVAPRDASGPQTALTGATPSRYYFEGHTHLSEPSSLTQLYGGGIDVGDLDGDGDLDVSVSGRPNQYRSGQHRVYQEENGVATERNLLLGTQGGPLHFLDYDGDGDLDLFTAGETTALYRNDRPRPADIPLAPTGLTATLSSEGVTFRWDSGDPSATYDIWVGSAHDQADVAAPPALLSSGRRTLPAAGTVGSGGEVTLRLAPGTYRWGVQRVSAERVGSPFASGRPFSVTATSIGDPELPAASGLEAPVPSPFATQTQFRFHLAEAGEAALVVYDVTGRRVRTLAEGRHTAGSYDLTWDGRDDGGHDLAAGIYFCRLKAGTQSFTRTVVRVH